MKNVDDTSFFKKLTKAQVLHQLDVADEQFALGKYIDSEIMEKELQDMITAKGAPLMSFNGVVEKAFDQLTDAQQNSIYELILLFNQSNTQTVKPKKNKVLYGAFKGGLNYIADDFDGTPEGFEEYT